MLEELPHLYRQHRQQVDADGEEAVIPLPAIPAIPSHLVMPDMIRQSMGGASGSSR